MDDSVNKNGTDSLIQVTRLPEIKQNLLTLKEHWEKKVALAESMLCTEDTIQAVKSFRAEMRKEFDEADTQRKMVAAQYVAPWKEVESVFKECVTDAFKKADDEFRGKIAAVEDAQKLAAEERCRAYFKELCVVHHTEFLTYEDAGYKITLSEAKKKTPTKAFDYLSKFVSRVSEDVSAITEPEVFAEYKSNGYNLSNAITTVNVRRKSIDEARKESEVRSEIKRQEDSAVTQVEAIAKPAVDSVPVVVERFNPRTVSFSFTIESQKQFDAVAPVLKELVKTLKEAGIVYD